MAGRVVVVGGWRAYLLLAALLALMLVLLFAVGVVALTLLAVGAVALVAHRALRALGLTRPARRASDGIIEGEYRVVERRPSDRSQG
jgi:hypothetical protein